MRGKEGGEQEIERERKRRKERRWGMETNQLSRPRQGKEYS